MNTQYKKGVLEVCVLAQIFKKDMYGYEIVQNISQTMEVNEGTIYPILRRLTKEGNFETYMQESNEGPARKYYKITEDGKKNLKEMVQDWYQFTDLVNELLKEVELS